MKNESAYSRKMTALLKKVRETHKPAPLPQYDPLTHVVMAFLQWNASRKMAEAAHARLMAPMVDINDLRVSHQYEVITLLGEDYPCVEERTARLHEVLQEIYNREHGMSLASAVGAGKKQARTYLESLPGMLSYVTSRVVLLSMGGHAMPVDDLLREKLIAQDAVDPQAGNEEIAAFLERLIKAGEGEAYHLALEEWAAAGGVKKALASAAKKAVKPASPLQPVPAAQPAKPVASTAKGSASKPATPRPAPAPKEKGGSIKTTQAKAAKATPAAVVTPGVKTEAKTTKKTAKKTTKKTTKKSTGRGTKKGD